VLLDFQMIFFDRGTGVLVSSVHSAQK